MKKTRFIGTVNGVSYNNVNDYNKAITEAIETGTLVNASSQTEVVDEPDPTNLLLGFNGDFDEDEYVDRFVSGNSNEDKLNLKKLEKLLNDNIEECLRAIYEMDSHAVENYQQEVENVLDVINNDIIATQNKYDEKLAKIAALKNEIEGLEQDIQIIKQGNSILDMWNSYYKDILTATTETLKKTAKKHQCKCQDGHAPCKNENGCNCCNNCEDNEDERKVNEAIESLKKLLNAFGLTEC